MKSPILNKQTEGYLGFKKKQSHYTIIKEGRLRFDLAEGLWSKNKEAPLPDRNSLQLKNALSNFLHLKLENISVFAGADEIIEIIPRLYLSPGDSVMVIVPTFERLITTNIKAGARIIPFILSPIDSFQFSKPDLNKLIEISKKEAIKVMWICTPNNPTGQIIDQKYIKEIALNLKDTLIVIDEAYQEFISLHPRNSAVNLVNTLSNILVIRSFSKAFGLAGARVAYATSSADIVSNLEKYRTMYNVATTSQQKAVVALSPDNIPKIKRLVDQVREERTNIYSKLEDFKNLIVVLNSETNFIFVRHKFKDLFQELYSRGIIVGDWRNSVGIEGKGFVRISVNRPRLNNILITALKDIG